VFEALFEAFISKEQIGWYENSKVFSFSIYFLYELDFSLKNWMIMVIKKRTKVTATTIIP